MLNVYQFLTNEMAWYKDFYYGRIWLLLLALDQFLFDEIE